jgi:hypothetical protein
VEVEGERWRYVQEDTIATRDVLSREVWSSQARAQLAGEDLPSALVENPDLPGALRSLRAMRRSARTRRAIQHDRRCLQNACIWASSWSSALR